MHRLPISVVIPAFNEERSISFALDSTVPYFDEVIVVDSGSTDKTVGLCNQYGVKVLYNKYIDMATQREFCVNSTGVKNKFVFNLDADEIVPYELIEELSHINFNCVNFSGVLINRRQWFMGRYLSYGGTAIELLRIVRVGSVRILKTNVVNEHTIVNGSVIKMKSFFLHRPRKSFIDWVERVIYGARKFSLTCKQYTHSKPLINSNEFVEGPVRTKINYIIVRRLPFLSRGALRFLFNYVFRLGFLDGWRGFAYLFINDILYYFFCWIFLKHAEIDPEFSDQPIAWRKEN